MFTHPGGYFRSLSLSGLLFTHLSKVGGGCTGAGLLFPIVMGPTVSPGTSERGLIQSRASVMSLVRMWSHWSRAGS